MKKISYLIVAFLVLPAAAFPQGSYNIDLLSQRNDHRWGGVGPDTSYHYSSVWGYTHPNGREYAIIGYWNGTAIYDITDAPNVVEIDTLAGPTYYYNYREFTVVGNYLYIVSEGTNTYYGLQIVNLSFLPDSIHHVTTWTGNGYLRAHTIKSEGNFLYLNGSNLNSGGIVVIDVTNRESPVMRGWGPALYVHDCFVRNDTVSIPIPVLRTQIISGERGTFIHTMLQENLWSRICRRACTYSGSPRPVLNRLAMKYRQRLSCIRIIRIHLIHPQK